MTTDALVFYALLIPSALLSLYGFLATLCKLTAKGNWGKFGLELGLLALAILVGFMVMFAWLALYVTLDKQLHLRTWQQVVGATVLTGCCIMSVTPFEKHVERLRQLGNRKVGWTE